MLDPASILKVLDGRGIAEVAGALVLVALLGWQGCAKHDIKVERDAYKNMYQQCENDRAAFKLNAKSWEDASAACSRSVADMRTASREAQEQLLGELRVARRDREITSRELQLLRTEVESGRLSVHDLLTRVRGL